MAGESIIEPKRVDDCIFCSVVAGDIASHVVDSDERTITVLDINPATPGHVVVIPRDHAENLLELPEADMLAAMHAARRVADRMKQTLEPAGFNVLTNVGRAAWQSIFHFHLHVIPRYEDDPLQLPWNPQPADPEQLAAIAAKLQG